MTISVGFIGVGGIASVHLEHVETIPDVSVRAVADIDEQRAENVARSYDATAYTDGERLIADEPLDAVVVAVPPFAHGPYERAATEQGLDVFVEKPLGLSMDAVRETQSIVERAGVLAQVGYVCRYAEITEKACELLADRKLGTIDSKYWVPAPPAEWWRERAKSGGQLVEQSTHVFDVHRYFGGDVASVVGVGTEQRLVEDVDFTDVTSATLTHESGCVTHVTSTCGASRSRFVVDVIAENAELTLDYFDHTLTGVVDGEHVAYSGSEAWYERELSAFIDAVRDDSTAPIRSTYDDAAETLALTLAAQRSADIGERIGL